MEQARLGAVAAEIAAHRAKREQMAAEATMGSTQMAPTAANTLPAIPPSSAHFEMTGRTDVPPSAARRAMYRTFFRVVDPERRLLGLEWQDGRGVRVPAFLGMSLDETRSVMSSEQPREDWTLVAYVGTDDAIASQTIRLENIALP